MVEGRRIDNGKDHGVGLRHHIGQHGTEGQGNSTEQLSSGKRQALEHWDTVTLEQLFELLGVFSLPSLCGEKTAENSK